MRPIEFPWIGEPQRAVGTGGDAAGTRATVARPRRTSPFHRPGDAPDRVARSLVNHRLPSGPAAMPAGRWMPLSTIATVPAGEAAVAGAEMPAAAECARACRDRNRTRLTGGATAATAATIRATIRAARINRGIVRPAISGLTSFWSSLHRSVRHGPPARPANGTSPPGRGAAPCSYAEPAAPPPIARNPSCLLPGCIPACPPTTP